MTPIGSYETLLMAFHAIEAKKRDNGQKNAIYWHFWVHLGNSFFKWSIDAGFIRVRGRKTWVFSNFPGGTPRNREFREFGGPMAPLFGEIYGFARSRGQISSFIEGFDDYLKNLTIN
jgi:hypothetical protein